MAKELRWERLWQLGQGASANAFEEFRNDSSEVIHIREISGDMNADGGGVGETGLTEISKSPVMAASVANNVFFTFALPIGGFNAAASGIAVHGRTKFARGQLTLEPGESLYVNHNLINGSYSIDIGFTIGYEF